MELDQAAGPGHRQARTRLGDLPRHHLPPRPALLRRDQRHGDPRRLRPHQAERPGQGRALPCTVVNGTDTGAKVTDCGAMGSEKRSGARLEVPRDLPAPRTRLRAPGTDNRNCNTNNLVRSDEGVAVSHEADPTHDGRFMFVTDERGGGIVPPGLIVRAGHRQPVRQRRRPRLRHQQPGQHQVRHDARAAKGRLHQRRRGAGGDVLRHPRHRAGARVSSGSSRRTTRRASRSSTTTSTRSGRLQFEEQASFTLPNANTWTAEDFKIRKNADGTRTYFIADERHPPRHRHRELDRPAQPGRRAGTGRLLGRHAHELGLVAAAALLLPGLRRAAPPPAGGPPWRLTALDRPSRLCGQAAEAIRGRLHSA